MRVWDPLFPQRLAHLLQARGQDAQAPTDLGVLGVVITIPGEAVLESLGGSLKGGVVYKSLATPAAGAEFSFVVPTRKVWVPLIFSAQLVTSAVAVTRFPRLRIREPGAATVLTIPAVATQAAGLTVAYNWARGLPARSGAGPSENTISMEFPGPYSPGYPEGWEFRSATGNLDGADQWSLVRAVVEEFDVA